MGKTANCCRAEPKRIRVAGETDMMEHKKGGIMRGSPRSSFKKPDSIMEPNFDRKYNTLDPAPAVKNKFQSVEAASYSPKRGISPSFKR